VVPGKANTAGWRTCILEVRRVGAVLPPTAGEAVLVLAVPVVFEVKSLN
jgi:hypothetical protein